MTSERRARSGTFRFGSPGKVRSGCGGGGGRGGVEPDRRRGGAGVPEGSDGAPTPSFQAWTPREPVDAVGEGGAEGYAVGDQVFGAVGKAYLGAGTLAGFTTVSAGNVTHKPPSLDHTVAAAIPTDGVTALNMADALDLSRGQTVIAVGSTGCVGSYFVQLAARRGARVVAICSGDNADNGRGLGAADVIDYEADDVADAVRSRHTDAIDAVADMHGHAERLARLASMSRPEAMWLRSSEPPTPRRSRRVGSRRRPSPGE